MSKKIISLTPIFTKPLEESTSSFIKSVSSGTGLGKTWSAARSVVEHIEYRVSSGNENPLIAILAAPQHNQLVVDGVTIDKLKNLGCDFLKIRPISSDSLSDIRSEMNAYDISKELFLNSAGVESNTFNQLRASFKAFDAKCPTAKNGALNDMVKKIDTIRSKIRIIEKEICAKPKSNDDYTYENNESDENNEIELDRKSESEAESARKILESMYHLAGLLTTICRKSYTDKVLFDEISKTLSKKSFNDFREVTGSFFPFMHIQRMGSKNTLLAMTINKMIVVQDILVPKFNVSAGMIEWVQGKARMEDIASDLSEVITNARENIFRCSENIGSENNAEEKLLDSDFIFFIDESDAAKDKISEKLSFDLHDGLLVQAIGALAKETGDVFAKDAYQSIASIIESNPDKNLAQIFMDHESDDSIPRIIAKETILTVRKKIYQTLIDSNWSSLNGAKNVDEIINRTNMFLRNSMSAPYCAIEKTIDSEVFSTTSAFGGEVYGFTGSKNIDNYIVVNMGGSFRVAEKSREVEFSSSCLPMSYFMLLISESYLYFRLLKKNGGSVSVDHEQSAKIDDIIAANDRKGILRYIRSSHLSKRSALSGIAAPFRGDKDNSTSSFEKHDVLHTSAAQQTILLSNRIAEDLFDKAFSDGKDLSSIINEDVSTFSSPKSAEIDIHYAYIKGHTIYGMAQTHDDNYPIREGCNHVVFPASFRSMSAEQYLTTLIKTNKRRNALFLLSATGGFENNHISAFSLPVLKNLAVRQGGSFLPMSADDYALTKLKQDERSQIKETAFRKSDEVYPKPFINDLFSTHSLKIAEYRRYLDSNKSKEPNYSESILSIDFSNPKKNTHKKTELSNAWSAIHYTHHKLSSFDKPGFSLALTQSNKNLLLSLKILCGYGSFRAGGENYFIERCVSSNESSSADFGKCDSYGIYVLKSDNSNRETISRFSKKSDNETIIICYSSALDKALPKLFRDISGHGKTDSRNLKKLLGLDQEDPFAPSMMVNFNAMDYLLSGVHGKNIIIVSPYGSGARGISYIINNGDTAKNLIKFRSQYLEKIKPSDYVKKDIDAVFICLAPYYCEVRTKAPGNKMDRKGAQKVFFNNCKMYLYYIEFLARKFEIDGHDCVKSEGVDLSTCKFDHDAENYFESQAFISLFSMLQQSLGRLERTIESQSQAVFMPPEAYEVFYNGLCAVTQGMNDSQIDEIIGCMSVINSRLCNEIMLDPGAYLPIKDDSVEAYQIENQDHKVSEFEYFKTCLIRSYASIRNDSYNMLENHRLIEVYEALRSWSIWTEGVDSYIEKLRDIVNAQDMDKDQLIRFNAVIDNLFFETDAEMVEYRTSFTSIGSRSSQVLNKNGKIYDFEKEMSRKNHTAINPYYSKIGKKHRYISPWFIADINGNYGEMIVSKAIDIIRKNKSIEVLDRTSSSSVRKSYEYADFFIRSGDTVIAIDAKHLSSAGVKEQGTYFGKNISEEFKEKLNENLGLIEGNFPGLTVLIFAINTNGDGHSSNSEKGVIKNRLVFTRDGNDSPSKIARSIVGLFNKKGL